MVSAITLFRFLSRVLGYLELQENPQDGAGFDLWVLVVDFLSVMAQLHAQRYFLPREQSTGQTAPMGSKARIWNTAAFPKSRVGTSTTAAIGQGGPPVR